MGWYAGIELGKVRCCGDWALKVMYQYVEPQAVFQDDLAGISIGNARKTAIYDGLQTEEEDLNPLNARGSTNFKGWSFDGAYAMTDDITIRMIYQVASEAVARVGGPQYYERFELRGIYAF